MKLFILLICFAFTLNTYSQKGTAKQATAANYKQGNTSISIIIDDGSPDDSVYLLLYDRNFIELNISNLIPPKTFVQKEKNGRFIFRFNLVDNIAYFSLKKNQPDYLKEGLLDFYLIEKGDNVVIHFYQDNIKFYGKGYEKFVCKSDLEKNNKTLEKETILKTNSLGESVIENGFKRSRRIIDAQLAQLKTYQSKISKLSFEIICADIIGANQFEAVNDAVNSIKSSALGTNMPYIKLVDSVSKHTLIYPHEIPDSILALSKNFVDYLWRMTHLTNIIVDDHSYNVRQLKEWPAGIMRDKVLIYSIYYIYKYSSNTDSLINTALSLCKNTLYRDILLKIHNPQKKGALAYNFSMVDFNGDTVKLSQFKGKVILMDFWYVGCTPCAAYYQNGVSKAEDYFRNNDNVVFITVGIEKDREFWKKAVASDKYTNREAINLFTGELGMKHPIVKHYNIQACPKPMLIGQDGKIITVNSFELGAGSPVNSGKLISSIENALTKEITY